MIHQTLLLRAVEKRDPILRDFIEKIGPAILTQFARVPALGGSAIGYVMAGNCVPTEARHIAQQARQRFSEMHDQSLTTHILNGIFAGMRIAEMLPAGHALEDLEKQLWLLGFVTHDYTKAYGVEVEAGNVPMIRQLIRCLGEEMHFADFLSDWIDYVDDIAFLAQNTQTVRGANLDLRSFSATRLASRRMRDLRALSSIADVLVHIKSPSDVAQRGTDGRDSASNLRDKMMVLFGAENASRFAYHQLSEVRGLLSNLINNVMMELLRAPGAEPFLFFPNGVVYLVSARANVLAPSMEDVLNRLLIQLADMFSTSDKFIKMGTTGLDVSSGLRELIGMDGVLSLGLDYVTRMGTPKSNKAPMRLYTFFTDQSQGDLVKLFDGDEARIEAEVMSVVQQQGLPHDLRVYRLGAYLDFLFGEAQAWFGKKTDVSARLLDTLKLTSIVSPDEAKKQKGGLYAGWYYAAAHFIKTNSTLGDSLLADELVRIREDFIAYLQSRGQPTIIKASIKDALSDHLGRVVQVNGRTVTRETHQQIARASFSTELACYAHVKTSSERACSVCSSPYNSTEQEATEMPFGPQQYSNKNPLLSGSIQRCICPLCRLEMMLRRTQQPRADEGNKPVQLCLYPTYFFTTETSDVVRQFLTFARDLNVAGLLSHLHKGGFTLESLASYEEFLREESDVFPRGIDPPVFSEHDAAGAFFMSLHSLADKPTDTDAWVLPTFYALALPMLLSLKVVATTSFVPIFNSGAEFRETVVLDAPHGFAKLTLGKDHFRVDELESAVMRLLHFYDLHLDVFKDGYDCHWPQINGVIREVLTDPLQIFSFYDQKKRHEQQSKEGKSKKRTQVPKDHIPDWDVAKYVGIYFKLGGEEHMGFIGKLVDSYAAFYRASRLDSAYAVLGPLSTAIDRIVDSPPEIAHDDLVLTVGGAVNDDIVRVMKDQSEGYIPLKVAAGEQWHQVLRSKIDEFAQLCVSEMFGGYCDGNRAILRERANRIRSAARFYYLQQYGKPKQSTQIGLNKEQSND